MSRDADRRLKRLERLERLKSGHETACLNRVKVHTKGLRPSKVHLRQELIVAPSGDRSPLSSLITPRGIALQMYLVALFDAQCRHRPGSAFRNDRALHGTEEGEIGWLELLAADASASTETSVERATELDNRLRQAKSAVRALAASNLARLAGEATRHGRFERFELGHESGSQPFLPYTVPQHDWFRRLSLPSGFFLKGWVHVLLPAEIATYLMLRHLAATYPGRHREGGVFVAGSVREAEYGLSRDVYEAHRALTAFRLIDRVPDERRRPDGRLRNYKEFAARDDGAGLPAHRFRVVADISLNRDALEVVAKRL
ncbi:hypothetical protein ACIA8G_35465 [Lentzea sp. NPDC051213]|uniref:hypothetical protein n=1 Tax=Lentzea sp. NPDC051213 TaxID=3364126 RepID=UPI0037AA2559